MPHQVQGTDARGPWIEMFEVAYEPDMADAATLLRRLEPDWSVDDHLDCDGERSLILLPEGDAAGRPTFQVSRDAGLYRVDAWWEEDGVLFGLHPSWTAAAGAIVEAAVASRAALC